MFTATFSAGLGETGSPATATSVGAFEFYKKAATVTSVPTDACWSKSGVLISTTELILGTYTEVSAGVQPQGTPQSDRHLHEQTFKFGNVPPSSTIIYTPTGGPSHFHICAKFNLYRGPVADNILVNMREIALDVSVTLDGAFNVTDIIAVSAITPGGTTSEIKYGCHVELCPGVVNGRVFNQDGSLIQDGSITPLHQLGGGAPGAGVSQFS